MTSAKMGTAESQLTEITYYSPADKESDEYEQAQNISARAVLHGTTVSHSRLICYKIKKIKDRKKNRVNVK